VRHTWEYGAVSVTLISSHFLMSPVQAVLMQDLENKVASWQQTASVPAKHLLFEPS